MEDKKYIGMDLTALAPIIVMLIAIVAGEVSWVNSIIAPVNEKIISLRADLEKNAIVDDRSIDDRLITHAKIATIETKFAEIETQFRNLDERTKRIEIAESADILILDTRLQHEIQAVQKMVDEVTKLQVRPGIESKSRNQ
jgi:biopolymer transport protein ExbB/TolQ